MPHNDYIQDYLMHHGILGQKWGVRRYQNADGSLTSVGQKRYNKSAKSYDKAIKQRDKAIANAEKEYRKLSYSKTTRSYEKRVEKAEKAINKAEKAARKAERKESQKDIWERNINQGKGKPKISKAEEFSKSITNTTKDVVSAGNKIIDQIPRKKSSYEDLTGYSDKDLQKIVNRIRLEQQYYSLTGQDTTRGREIAKNILDNVGSVVAIAGGTVGIIATAKSLKSK